MDSQTAAVIAYAALMTSLLGIIYTAINHKRIRSNCCGKIGEVSLDIGPTTPPNAPIAALPAV